MVKFNDEMNDWLRDDENSTAKAMLQTCIYLAIVLLSAISCCKSFARLVPWNYISLSLFTVCWAYVVTLLCALCDKEIALMSSVSTAAITFSLTL